MKLRLGLFCPNYTHGISYNSVSASVWIRALQMIKYYRGMNYRVNVNKYLKLNDIAVIYRENTQKTLNKIKYLKYLNRKVYWDTCVNYTELHDQTSEESVNNCHKILKLVDGVIVPTEKLKEYVLPYNNNIHVMDDPINFEHFNIIKKDINWDNPVFGWSGISKKTYCLNEFKDVINNKILLITDKNIEKQSLLFEYDFEHWRYETFLEALLNVDIAFLPRIYDDPYNICHSSFKALVFAALGIPIIANKIPSYVKLAGLYDGIVFLEDFNDNIEACINALKSRNLSNELIKKYYSCEKQADKFLSFVNKNFE